MRKPVGARRVRNDDLYVLGKGVVVLLITACFNDKILMVEVVRFRFQINLNVLKFSNRPTSEHVTTNVRLKTFVC